MRSARVLAALAIGACAMQSHAFDPPIPGPALKQGSAFTSAEARGMQADDFANPGMLWVERGAKLWREPAGASAKSCASCHGEAEKSMKDVATHYPRIDPGAARVVNLDERIDLCRTRNQRAEPLPHESDERLALSAYVTHQSRGLPMKIELDMHNARAFEKGRERFYRRIGQMNLACAHCHDRSWGRTLMRETISQGQPTGFPAYRLEWQKVGSLQRRIRACYSGLHAEMPAYGARELVELELFLAWRANGLPIEAPGVRK